MTTVWAWEKTVVMVKQPGHLTSMKKDRGAGTRFYDSLVRLIPFVTKHWYSNHSMSDAYLELVLAGLSGWAWVEEINCENLDK